MSTRDHQTYRPYCFWHWKQLHYFVFFFFKNYFHVKIWRVVSVKKWCIFLKFLRFRNLSKGMLHSTLDLHHLHPENTTVKNENAANSKSLFVGLRLTWNQLKDYWWINQIESLCVTYLLKALALIHFALSTQSDGSESLN